MGAKISESVLRDMTMADMIYAARGSLIDTRPNGLIYVLESSDIDYWGLYKIGRTTSLARRIKELEQDYGCFLWPVTVIWTDDPAFLEAHIHNAFSVFRVPWTLQGREWFSLSTAQVGWFCSLSAVDTTWIRHLQREHKNATL